MVQEKKIITKVTGWLTLFDDGSVDRTWSGQPEVKFLNDAVPPHDHFVDGVATADVTSPDGLKLRVYLPEKHETDPEELPVLLHFHDGGFCITSANWHVYYAAYTRLARAIVVSPYLRLVPEHRLPAAVDDGLAALRWVAGAGGYPGRRVFLIGDSSGGNIVREMAVRAGEDGTPVAGAIPMHPGFCRAGRSRSEVENPETPFFTVEMINGLLEMGLPEEATKDHQITCPMGEARHRWRGSFTRR